MRHIVIFGAEGSAREVAWLAREAHFQEQALIPAAFADSDDSPRLGNSQNGLPILSAKTARSRFPDALAVVAVGNTHLRRDIAEQARKAGFRFGSVIHYRALVSSSAQLGEGVVIYPHAIISTNVRIGNHVQINAGSIVSHDSLLDDYVTLSPGVSICGYAHLKEDVFVGAGATVINGSSIRRLTLGPGASIGAGACVVSDVPNGALAKGVPARFKEVR